MIQFEFGRLWWIIAIPIFLLFVFLLYQVQKRYTIPCFYEAQEVLRRVKSDKKRFCYSIIMVLAVLSYLFLFLYCIAFIVQLTLEAELSWTGFFLFVLYICLSILFNKLLVYEKKKLNEWRKGEKLWKWVCIVSFLYSP